jgi:uncharacterized membrane protein
MGIRAGFFTAKERNMERIGGQTSGRGDFAAAVNVGDSERVLSAVAGGAALLYGLARGSFGGWTLAGLGAMLAYRGLTGHCNVYQALGIDRSQVDGRRVSGNLGIKVEASAAVNAPPERVYGAWRNFANLPRFMSHVERVEELGRTRSRWTVRAPAGMNVTWDAEIINDVPNQLIAWRTVDTKLVAHAGSVQFDRAHDGRGTMVRVSMQYDPPAGEVGHALATALGQDPERQIEQDLQAFKRAMEAGELAA